MDIASLCTLIPMGWLAEAVQIPNGDLNPTYNNVAGGEAVVFLKTVDGDNYYCCGTPLLGDNTAECFYNQSSFTLGDGQLMFGYAGLEDATRTSSAGSSSATATSSASTTNISPTSATMTATTTTLSQSDAAAQTGGPQCQGDTGNMKVGVGVGVPLGVTALLAVAWALWERRKRLSTKPTVAAPDRDFTQLSPSPARYYYEMMGQVGQAESVQHVTGTVAELHDQARPFEVTDVMETSPYKPNMNQ
ncbi:hypothetical protein VM1G_06267 [Cytospora mali]|uniref:Mid2 domain-containing protein n=1 Tax=Cytospora mali TaxID=578113 RepID=A0A194W411_CYTMA|nr:hypothetical protein VM1G_06267 [Valsa mali]